MAENLLIRFQAEAESIQWMMVDHVPCVNDFGESVQLTVALPAMLKKMVQEASMRSLERSAAEKLDLGCRRVWFDVKRTGSAPNSS